MICRFQQEEERPSFGSPAQISCVYITNGEHLWPRTDLWEPSEEAPLNINEVVNNQIVAEPFFLSRRSVTSSGGQSFIQLRVVGLGPTLDAVVSQKQSPDFGATRLHERYN